MGRLEVLKSIQLQMIYFYLIRILLLYHPGAYSYVMPRTMTATRELNKKEKRPRYVGRLVSSAPATGMTKVHKREYQNILEGVFGEAEETE